MSFIDLVERLGEDRYRVSVRLRERTVPFVFQVDRRNGLDVVSWDPAFEAVMQRSVGRAQPILAAVLALHQAQACIANIEDP